MPPRHTVTRVTADSDGEITLTVHRVGSRLDTGGAPTPDQIPQGARDALTAWLAGATQSAPAAPGSGLVQAAGLVQKLRSITDSAREAKAAREAASVDAGGPDGPTGGDAPTLDAPETRDPAAQPRFTTPTNPQPASRWSARIWAMDGQHLTVHHDVSARIIHTPPADDDAAVERTLRIHPASRQAMRAWLAHHDNQSLQVGHRGLMWRVTRIDDGTHMDFTIVPVSGTWKRHAAAPAPTAPHEVAPGLTVTGVERAPEPGEPDYTCRPPADDDPMPPMPGSSGLTVAGVEALRDAWDASRTPSSMASCPGCTTECGDHYPYCPHASYGRDACPCFTDQCGA